MKMVGTQQVKPVTRYVNLFRTKRSDHGTEGILSTGNFTCFTLELPWKGNRTDISCIPAGTYPARLRTSPRHGRVYHLNGIERRRHILMHSGNFAGDVAKGLKTHVSGCILLGKYRGLLENQKAVLCSRPTLSSFMFFMDFEPFELTIFEAF